MWINIKIGGDIDLEIFKPSHPPKPQAQPDDQASQESTQILPSQPTPSQNQSYPKPSENLLNQTPIQNTPNQNQSPPTPTPQSQSNITIPPAIQQKQRIFSNYFKLSYFPLVTIILIILNILAFFLFIIYSTAKDTNIVSFISTSGDVSEEQLKFTSCLEENYPQYLKIRDTKETKNCLSYLSKSYEKICLYDVDDSYIGDYSAQKKCLNGKQWIEHQYGYIPVKFGNYRSFMTMFTSLFIHSNIAHIGANMFFLLIVGAFVESRLKKIKFILLYLLAGLSGSLFYTLFNSNPNLPVVGASGAISGLLGANLVFRYFKSRENVQASIHGHQIYGFGIGFIILWIILQFIYVSADSGGGVAYADHIGGFFGGFILAYLLRDKSPIQISPTNPTTQTQQNTNPTQNTSLNNNQTNTWK